MPGTVGLSDLSVSRSAAAGWGTATSGQVYAITTGTAADFAVTAGVGTMSHGAVNTRHQVQTSWGTADWDETITVSIPVVATGASIEADVVGRQIDVNNYYYGGVVFGLTGALSAVVGQRVGGTNTLLATYTTSLTYAANTQIRVRCAGVTVGAAVRLFVKIWLASTAEPSSWTGVFLQPFATVNSGGILGNGLIGVQSALAAGNTNTLPVVISFINYRTNSVGLPYPLTTEGMCADPTSNTYPKQVELAATALAVDAYMAATIDPIISAVVSRPYCVISSNNQTLDTSTFRSVPFDTLDFNQGTNTNLALANGIVVGPGWWLFEAEEILPLGSTVGGGNLVWAIGGGYSSPGNGSSPTSLMQRTNNQIGSAVQLSALRQVSSGTILVGVNLNRSDATGAFTYNRIQLSAYKVASL